MRELLQLKVRLLHLSPKPEFVSLSGLQEAFSSLPARFVQASHLTFAYVRALLVPRVFSAGVIVCASCQRRAFKHGKS